MNLIEQPASLRLFIALDLPDYLQQQIAARYTKRQELRWTPPERLHLTLSFIGSTAPAALPRLDSLLQTIDFEPFTLQIDRLGCFQHHLWLGCAPEPGLMALQQQLQQRLPEAGLLNPPTHSFQPHITVARLTTADTALLPGQLQASLIPHALRWEVDQFSLKNSVLTASGALHRILALYNARPSY